MKFKKDYTNLCLQLAAQAAAVANHLAGDSEDPLSDDEARTFVARALRTQKASILAAALRVDEDTVKKALSELFVVVPKAEAA